MGVPLHSALADLRVRSAMHLVTRPPSSSDLLQQAIFFLSIFRNDHSSSSMHTLVFGHHTRFIRTTEAERGSRCMQRSHGMHAGPAAVRSCYGFPVESAAPELLRRHRRETLQILVVGEIIRGDDAPWPKPSTMAKAVLSITVSTSRCGSAATRSQGPVNARSSPSLIVAIHMVNPSRWLSALTLAASDTADTVTARKPEITVFHTVICWTPCFCASDCRRGLRPLPALLHAWQHHACACGPACMTPPAVAANVSVSGSPAI